MKLFPQAHRSRWLLAGAVTALAGGVAVASPWSTGGATAADASQRVVGTKAINLTQPADVSLGRMTPSNDADTKGMFAPQVEWPLIPLHTALAPNGHLISYGSPLQVAAQEGLVYDDWNPARGTVAGSHQFTPSMGGVNSFCNQLELMPDGRMLMVGGNSTMSAMTFDPASKQVAMMPNLQRQRWYPTVLRRPDDRFVVIGGANWYAYNAYLQPDNNAVVATVPEIGTGTSNWSLLPGAESTANFGARDNRWWYPRAFNAPNGDVFGISGDRMWSMKTTGTGAIANVGTLPTSIGASGAAVMYAPGKILAAGGNEVANGTRTVATGATTLIDINGATPAARAAAAMAYRRQWLNLTVLPTGHVLANGGTVVGTDGGAANSSYTAELWDPATGAWTKGADAKRIRTYHSVAILMPSGAVVTAAGGIPGPEDNFNAEMYYPPSLFTRGSDGVVRWASRPELRQMAGYLTWGGRLALKLSDGRKLASVSLIKAGAVTHSINTDQRRIPLTFSQYGNWTSATLPKSKDTLPAGTYLLTAVDTNGVPSPSQLVTLRNGAQGTVTVFEPDQSEGQVGGDGVSLAGVVPLQPGTSVGLEPFNAQGHRVRHQYFAGRVDPIGPTSSNLDRADSGFVVRAGRASASGVSFEASNYPGYYLTASQGEIVLRKPDGSAAAAAAATFRAEAGLAGQGTSLRSWADTNLYLRHDGAALRVQASDGSDQFRLDATWRPRAAFGPAPGFYRVANANSGLRLAPSGGATGWGTSVVQDTASDRLSQIWELRDAGGGEYKLFNATSGLLLGVREMSRVNGGTALTWGDTGTADHRWRVVPRDGRWAFVNVHSGLMLGVDSMSKSAGAQVLQWDDNGTLDHLWDIESLGAPTKGRLQLTNSSSRLVLGTRDASTAAGAGVVQATPSDSDTQIWTVVAAGGGASKLYNQASGLVLGLEAAEQAAGTAAVAEPDNGAVDHRWRVVPRDGAVWLVNASSNQVLGVDGSAVAGAPVRQRADSGGADQRWTLATR
jgi:Alpha-L-arabinofuranosidase B (ABFB) domain/Domain of unknown function (DUF1929)/Ricin-type beta-trefoil lectin domain-like